MEGINILDEYKDIVKREGNRVSGTHCGFETRVVRSCLGHLCGYVGVPEGHTAFGVHYDDEVFNNVMVHGGLTYSDHFDAYEECDNHRMWYLGFDTAHVGDLSIYDVPYHNVDRTGDVYRDMEYVKNQVDSLAEQLAAIDNRLLVGEVTA